MARKYKLSKTNTRNFAEKFFPARPKQIVSKARSFSQKTIEVPKNLGLPNASNLAYIKWLRKESMLQNASKQARLYSGQGRMWENPYARPQPRRAIGMASVWYTAYPVSMITKPKQSILGALGDEDLWSVFSEIGIEALHTGPMKRAGGQKGWNTTPSIDGHFDRISTKIDPIFGTETEFKKMCQVAAKNGAIILDDIVPGHTGKGADFRLAEMNYGEYPGIYHMVEIRKEDWHLLPDPPKGKDSINIDATVEKKLKDAGYIIGKLSRVIFYEPGVKDTNWSVTKKVKGVDGKQRRWVYLHYFKGGQPSINWLDPTFAGMKLVIGDAMHSIGDLGTNALRLDANGFLGIEKGSDETDAWSEGHPLSEAANHLIASMVRKFGGFTFQELNLSVDDIKTMSTDGADLSYDFVTRPAYHHALATGDTEFLRIMMQSAKDLDVDPASLVHALQNHDELTYELVHLWTIHKDDMFTYHDKEIKGIELRDIIRKDLKEALSGEGTSYNLPFAENGIACTTVSSICAILGYSDIENLSDSAIEQITQAHLLLAMFNAMQPGVFALSGWDLSGALTLDKEQTKELIKEGDTRWINRGSYDLLSNNPSANVSSSGMPKAISLYGDLPNQLKDETSFASRLKKLLSVREKYGIALSKQIDVPKCSNPAILAMLHKLPENDDLQMTILNFSGSKVKEEITSDFLPPDATVTNMLESQEEEKVSQKKSLTVSLQPYEGVSLLISK